MFKLLQIKQVVHTKTVHFENFCIQISWRARARQMKIRIGKNNTVLLTLPVHTSEKVGLEFVKKSSEWILEHLQNAKALFFMPDMHISVLGTPVIIRHISSDKGGTRIEGENLIVSGDIQHLHRRVRDFIKKQSYAYIQNLAIQKATLIHEKPSRITLKDTSSRWGSCSTAKNLNFCWKLALAPDFVLDYIVAHEVAHMKEMNHSDRFWAVVGQLTEHRADAEIWLRRHGSELQGWE